MILRAVCLSLSLVVAIIPLEGVAAQQAELAKIVNPIAQRLEVRLARGREIDGWTAYRNQRTGPGQYAIAATPGLETSATPAMLMVSCIENQPAVSVVFDGRGEVLSALTRVDLRLDAQPVRESIASPLMGRDAFGIFDVRAALLIQDIRKSKSLEVSLPRQGQSWRFAVEGLDEAVEYMQDHCGFSYQINIVQSELAQVQMKLRLQGYDVPTTGYMDDQMKAATRDFQETYGLPETGRLDQRTYDLMLKKIGE